MASKVSTRELGLILGARLLKSEDLHYGYWSDELPVKLVNLPAAQTAYSEFLIGQIPSGVRSVLDVGCGTGHLAQLLMLRGFAVEGVSPSPVLSDLTRRRLGEGFPIHSGPFETVAIPGRYDLVLFAESFQYIPPAVVLARARGLLNPDGYVLICDFFATGAPGRSPLRGGHDLTGFYGLVEQQAFRVLEDRDITERTAPNMTVLEEFLRDYVAPIWETAGYWLRQNHPWLTAMGRFLFRRRLEKIQYYYFSRSRTAESFARHKSYRCVLLQVRGPG